MNIEQLPFVVGLAGRKGSGKTTLAKLLAASSNAVTDAQLKPQMVALAQPLKDMIAMLLTYKGIPQPELVQYIEGDKKEQPIIKDVTARKLMQTLGTEWGRSIDENLWTDIIENDVKELLNSYKADVKWLKEKQPETALPARPFIIISDVRFPNEVEMVRRLGGKVFWVSRVDEPADGHASEASLTISGCDGKIDNNGHIADSLKQLMDACGFYAAEEITGDVVDAEATIDG